MHVSCVHVNVHMLTVLGHSDKHGHLHTHTHIYLRAAAPAADPGKNTRRFVTQHSFSVLFFFCVDQIQQYGHQLWWRWLFGCHLTQLSGTQFFQTHKTLSHTILDGISHMFG